MTQFAVIKVRMGEHGMAYPIVERVPNGWQSGEHHYPDATVLHIQPLHLVQPPEPAHNDDDDPLDPDSTSCFRCGHDPLDDLHPGGCTRCDCSSPFGGLT